MSETAFVNDARVMSKGQVTIPKNVRKALGITTGDRVTFVVEGNSVKVINSAIYALEQFQKQMSGRAEGVGFVNEESIVEWISESRRKKGE